MPPMFRPRTRRRLSTVVLVTALVTALVVAAGLATAADPPTPGRHDEHSRFTDRSAGFPPQPRDATHVRAVPGDPATPATVRAEVTSDGAVGLALADPDVRDAAGERVEVVGVERVGDKGALPDASVVTLYGHEPAASVLATVADGRVVSVESIPAGEWQPPMTADERARAVEVSRDHWRAAGHDRVEVLEGYTIHALEPDGRPYPTRMAYTSFHVDVDSRPELVAWVDLTAGEVVRSRVEAPPQDGTGDTPSPRRSAGEATEYRGHRDWHGWSLDFDLSGRDDGISLSSVTYEGIPVFDRVSMPAMTVFYDHPPGTPPEDTCGPFVDRLGLTGGLTPVYWADDAEVVIREFEQLGQSWLEFGILDTLGNYVLYQSWYLSADGQLDAHTFAKGLQCEFDHVHYPFWRFDVDLAGPADDVITRRLPSGELEVLDSEFDAPADSAVGHEWAVTDTVTGDTVHLAFDDGSWNVPGQVVPEELYATNVVSGRVVDSREQGAWRLPALVDLGYNDGASLDGADISLWYRGFLPHTAEEGPELWHSTGVRMQVELAPRYYPRRPR